MNTSRADQKQAFISLRLKIWFIFLLVFIPTYIAIFYWYYFFTVKHELDFLTTDLSNQVNGIINSIDIENFKALYEQETAKNANCPPKAGTSFEDAKNGYFPADNPLFIEHMDWIEHMSILEAQRSVYTYVKGPEKDYVIIISSSWYFTNREESFKFCQLYKGPIMYKGLSERVDRWEPYQDEYGYWISSYTPITDKNGEIVGAVGVDVPASQIADIRKDLLQTSLIMFLITVLISFGIAYNLTEMISTPLGRLTSLTANVKDSISHTDFSDIDLKRGGLRDEIDILYESVKSMMGRLNKQTAELSQSRAEMQELAHGVIRIQENERKYISRELHGEAGQLLAMLKTTLDDILLDLPADAEHPESNELSSLRERLVYSARQIEQTLGLVRAISHQLRPSLLDVGDVNLALKDYCSEFSQHQKITVFYEGFIVPNPSEEIAVSYYRFLQEALINVTKHTSANKIWVRSQMDEDWIQISVEDNGNGHRSTPADKGIGIAGLKERFFLLGGTVEARPIPGGFLIVARAPLTRR